MFYSASAVSLMRYRQIN